MENASKALIIAGAILLSILIIGVGIFIFTSSQGTIDEALTSMSTQEVQAFNAQFTSYQGTEISGTQVKSLLTILAANCATYEDESSKVPNVYAVLYNKQKGIKRTIIADLVNKNQTIEQYMDNVSHMRNILVNKNTYKVEMKFNTFGIINFIKITEVN